MENVSAPEEKSRRHRSPAYPGINLQQALSRLAEFYDKEHRNPASFKAAVSHWGYSEKSSGPLVMVAALKSFGLLDELDSDTGRTFQVSQLGLKIVADKRPQSSERDDAIREASLKPKIHAELWRKYNGRLPSDAELQYRLENDWHFNIKAIGPFIKELRDTISFARLTQSDSIAAALEQDTEGTSENEESSAPATQPTGIRMASQTPNGASLHCKPRDHISNLRNEVFSLDDGGEVIITWPSPLPTAVIADIKDWLRIVERKIERSGAASLSLDPNN